MRFGQCGELAAHCGWAWRWYGGSVPEVDSLGTDGAVPELLEASGLSARSRCMSAGICALEEGSEGAEDAGAGAERHDRELCPVLSRSAIRLRGGIGASRVRSRPERVSCASAVAMSGSSTEMINPGLRWGCSDWLGLFGQGVRLAA